MEALIQQEINKKHEITVVAVDIGYMNMAICVVYADKRVPLLEHRTILRSRTGEVFDEMEEGHIAEMIYRWIGEIYAPILSKAKIICLEKQLSDKMFFKRNRRCVYIESTLHAMLMVMRGLGGPLVCVVSPTVWQNKAGIKTGGGKIKNGESSLINPNYEEHKVRNAQKYDEFWTHGEPFIKKIQDHYKLAMTDPRKRKQDDRKEAALFAKAVLSNMPYYIEKAMKFHNCNRIEREGAPKRLSATWRMTPPRPFLTYKDFEENQGEEIEITATASASKRMKKDTKPAKKPRKPKDPNHGIEAMFNKLEAAKTKSFIIIE